MAFFDLPLPELETYRPHVREPEDFDEFWTRTLAETRAFDLNVTATKLNTSLKFVDSYDVEFSGFGGHRIKAWLNLPAGAEPGSLPAIVQYQGYGGGRGYAQEHLLWANAGYAHLFMDTRGQGSGWGSGGHTADPAGTGASGPGFMTKGIGNADDYYYRRVYADGVRAVEAIRTFAQVDATRVSITGASQGGGITLAVAGLVDNLYAVMPDVPFLCNFERATSLIDNDPYHEITRYLAVHRTHVDQVFNTLSYFDGVNFARRATAPALFSVALMDGICPPSTVYSAYNHYANDNRAIEIYPYNGHEGGEFGHKLTQVAWLNRELAQSTTRTPNPTRTRT